MNNITAIFPGGFKPPHKGHFELVNSIKNDYKNIIIITGIKPRDGITQLQSYQIWKIYKSYLNNITILKSEKSPINKIFNLLKSSKDGELFDLILSKKDECSDRFNSIILKFPNKINKIRILDEFENEISSSKVRDKIKNELLVKDSLPSQLSDIHKNLCKEIIMLNKYKCGYEIFCDMDGVLTDFNKQFKNSKRGYDLIPGEFKSDKDFWKIIEDEGLKFWEGMEWCIDGKELWNYISYYKPKLLSAPSKDKNSIIGKNKWVKRELKGIKLLLESAENKQKYSSPISILIDDRKYNIEEWESKGGIGILHINTKETIKILSKYGL